MRILQLVTQREPAGAQGVADRLDTGFRARGHTSDVWFLYRKHSAFEAVDYRDLMEARPGSLGALRLLVLLVRELRAFKPDVLVAHTHHAICFGGFAARVAGVPFRIGVHHATGSSEGRARRWIVAAIRRTGFLTAEVFVSETTWRSHGSIKNGVIIYNGITLDQAVPDRWDNDPRADLTDPLVVSVGRLEQQKDHRTLIRAVGPVANAHVAILGEGSLRNALGETAGASGMGERLHLLGNVPPEEVGAALAAATVVALPSEWEAFSVIALEAMAAGAALLVSDIPAHREAFADAALYHGTGDSDGLRSGLRRLLSDPELRATMGQRARDRVRSFGADHMVEQYLGLMIDSGSSP